MPTNINFSNNLGILSGNSISIAQTLTSFCNEYSMTFDGVSDYFEGSSTFSELDGQSQFSLSMWIKPDALDAIRVLFHIQKNTTAAASQVLVFLRNNGVLDISADVSSKYCRSQVGSIQPGVWNHVLICFDLSQGTTANKIRPFVNGVDVYDTSNGLGSSFVTSTGPIHLGEEANGWQAPFLGKMDEVALWNSDQRANVSDIYNGGLPFDFSTLGTPPDHWYRMGDNDVFNTNWTLSDNVGSYDLTSTTQPVGARVTDVPFINEYSMTFDGSSDYAFVGTSSLGITSAITVSAWVKILTTNTGGGGTNIQTIICEDTTSGGQRNWNLSWRGTGFNYFQWAVWHTDLSATSITSTGVVPNDGFWHHVMGTYDGTSGANGMKLYIDGVLNVQGTASSTGINSFTSSEATIGALTAAVGRFFEGKIDEAAVWDSDESSNINSIYSSSGALDISCLNPLSWWRMGDGDSFSNPGGVGDWTFFDNGSGGNDATSTTLPESARVPDVPPSPFVNEYSIEFDGLGSYFNLASRTQSFTDFSLSFWVVWGGGNYKAIVGSSTAEGGILTAIVQAGSTIRYFDNTSGWTTLSGDISDGFWHHILITYDSTANTLKGYTDGNLSVTKTSVDPINPTNAHSFDQIGARLSGSFYNQKLDEINVWDSIIDIADVWNGSGIPIDLTNTNPIHWWRMGDGDTWNGSSWVLTDNGSATIDATSVSMLESARLPISPSSYSLSSFVFDGISDGVDMGNPTDLQITGSITLSAWIKTTDASSFEVIIGKDNVVSGTRSYTLYKSTNAAAFVIFKSNVASSVIGTTTINDGNWHHIMGVNDGTDLKIYVDGALDGTSVGGGGTIDNGTFDFKIGRRGGTSAQRGYWTGNIDEVYVWDNDQSGNISTIYGNGVPTDLSSLNPLGHWRFGETDIFSTTWTFLDQGSGGNNGTSSTLPESAKTGDQPYVL